MQPRIHVITLGVDNLSRALAFYRDGLGFPTEGIVGEQWEDGAVVFFHLQNGLTLALYPRNALAKDAAVELGTPSATEFSIGHLVASETDVDAIMQKAERAGARVVDRAKKRFWGGYSGYFQDLDGHLWEVAWNPAWDT